MRDKNTVLSSRICMGWENLDALASDWDRILQSCSKGIRGPDVTCSRVWARALRQTLLQGSQLQTLVVSSVCETVAIIPTYRDVVRAIPFEKRELRVITEAHGGRGGLLISRDDPEIAEFALANIKTRLAPWDVFLFGIVEHTASHAVVVRAAQRLSLGVRCLAVNESP
jgi:hypothetical protein